jgi:MFS family permease
MSILERLRKEKQVFYLALASAFRGFYYNVQGVLWQPFSISLGLPMTSIGALTSLMEISRIALMPVLGAASDRIGRKKFLLIRDALVLMGFLCFIFARSWLLLSVGLVLFGLSSSFLPIWQTLIVESSGSENIGYVFSIIGSAFMLAGMIGTFFSGYITDFFGYRVSYGLTTLFATFSLYIITWKIEDTSVKEDQDVSVRRVLGTIFETFKPPRYLWGYYIAMSVDLFAFSLGMSLIYGMLTARYGFTPSMLGVIFTAGNLSMAVFQIILGRYVDKVGYVKYLVISQVIATLFLGILFFNQSFIGVLFAIILNGLAGAFWGPAEQSWIAKNVDPEERAKSIGRYSTFRGLIAFPGPFIGGVLFDTFGYHAPIGGNMVLSFVDIFLIWFLVKDKINPTDR